MSAGTTTTAADARKLRVLRLSERADAALRTHCCRRGDVSATVNRAVLGTDLKAVQVFRRDKAPFSGHQPFFNTSAIFEPGVYEKAKEAAARRGCSVMELIDGAIIHFCQPTPRADGKRQESLPC